MNRLRHLMSLCIFISLMACEQNEDWVVNEPMQSFEVFTTDYYSIFYR